MTLLRLFVTTNRKIKTGSEFAKLGSYCAYSTIFLAIRFFPFYAIAREVYDECTYPLILLVNVNPDLTILSTNSSRLSESEFTNHSRTILVAANSLEISNL
jgi:hypothetical protein